MSRWDGWWEQRGLGRQRMHDLMLDVTADGAVRGGGSDCVGPFTFEGRFRRDGTIRLVKQYLGRHHVIYDGNNLGEGIAGTWHIPGFNSGRFALKPLNDRTANAEEVAVRANRATPAGA